VVFAIQASGITIGTAPYTFDDLPDRLRRMINSTERPVKVTGVPPVQSGRLAVPRVKIESVGIVPPEARPPRDSLELARLAGEDCFAHSRHQRKEIDLLINTGVYRNEFICEPAIAAMIAGKLEINDAIEQPDQTKTLAYDIFNGAVGFLNGCCNAVAMIKSRKHRHAMVVTSEIENNAELMPDRLLHLRETGSALILEENTTDGSGFGNFLFKHFAPYIDALVSSIGQEKGHNFLRFVKHPNIEQFYLECIPLAVRELLEKEGLELAQIKAIFPPQISSSFIRLLGERLQVARERFVDLAQDGKDLFTSSFAYGLRQAQQQGLVKAGDIGLIIHVGSGIQVGCAIYYF
jgi:3-oxoacyl-[acyl-carrier-protein] synthase III